MLGLAVFVSLLTSHLSLPQPLPTFGTTDVVPVKPPPLLLLAYPEEASPELWDAWAAWINEHAPYGIAVGDLDWDFDVDQTDVELFRICLAFSGPGVAARGRIGNPPVLEMGCGLADLDRDADVDGVDFAALQRLVGRPATLYGQSGSMASPAAAASSRPRP